MRVAARVSLRGSMRVRARAARFHVRSVREAVAQARVVDELEHPPLQPGLEGNSAAAEVALAGETHTCARPSRQ